ncbi:UDP-N-acetylmuramoyl-L-alanine--D-glutamate ligase [Patescibacteria group bacterium]
MIDHPYLNKLRDKEIHLVGLASAEISAVAEFLFAEGCKNLVAHDIYAGVEFKRAFRNAHQGLSRAEQVKALKKLEALPIQKKTGSKYLSGIEKAEVIFPTQGWFLYEKSQRVLQPLLDQGVEFGSMTKLYLQLAPGIVVGVTGTNGKGTTTHLIADMLKAGGKKVYLAGNDPKSVQVLDKLSKMKPEDYLVLEVSNRQLMLDLGKSPHIGVITNITPNHLDEHHNVFAEYVKVKNSLLKYQQLNDIAVLNFDNNNSMSLAEQLESQVFGFSVYKQVTRGAMVEKDEIIYKQDGEREKIAETSVVKLPGKYNLENILAAVVVAKQCEVNNQAIAKVCGSFTGLPQRLEFIKEFEQVRYYNDLYSTTPASTEQAIASFSEPVVLIAGGDAKGVDYFDMAEIIKKKVRKLWLFPGSASDKLQKHLAELNYREIELIEDFDECLKETKKEARPGEIVILSPGGAHFQSKFIGKKSPGFNALVDSW